MTLTCSWPLARCQVPASCPGNDPGAGPGMPVLSQARHGAGCVLGAPGCSWDLMWPFYSSVTWATLSWVPGHKQ